MIAFIILYTSNLQFEVLIQYRGGRCRNPHLSSIRLCYPVCHMQNPCHMHAPCGAQSALLLQYVIRWYAFIPTTPAIAPPLSGDVITTCFPCESWTKNQFQGRRLCQCYLYLALRLGGHGQGGRGGAEHHKKNQFAHFDVCRVHLFTYVDLSHASFYLYGLLSLITARFLN